MFQHPKVSNEATFNQGIYGMTWSQLGGWDPDLLQSSLVPAAATMLALTSLKVQSYYYTSLRWTPTIKHHTILWSCQNTTNSAHLCKTFAALTLTIGWGRVLQDLSLKTYVSVVNLSIVYYISLYMIFMTHIWNSGFGHKVSQKWFCLEDWLVWLAHMFLSLLPMLVNFRDKESQTDTSSHLGIQSVSMLYHSGTLFKLFSCQ